MGAQQSRWAEKTHNIWTWARLAHDTQTGFFSPVKAKVFRHHRSLEDEVPCIQN